MSRRTGGVRLGAAVLALSVAGSLAGETRAGKGGGRPSAPKAPTVHAPSPPRMPQYHPPKPVPLPRGSNTVHLQTPKPKPATPKLPVPKRNAAPPTSAAVGGAVVGVPAGPVVGARRSNGLRRSYHRGYGSGYRRGYYGNRNGTSTLQRQQAQRLQRLRKLVADLDALTPGSAPGATQRMTLRNDLLALAPNSARPARAGVDTLSEKLVEALPARKSPALNTLALAEDLEVAVNARQAGAGGVAQAVSDAQTVLKLGGVTRAGADAVTLAMRTLGADGPR